MSKYDFILYVGQREDFIEQLRGLALVDITTTGWEPSEEDRQLLLDIEGHAKASECIRTLRAEGRCAEQAKPFDSGEEAYAHYVAAQQQATTLSAEISRLEKVADELRPWGPFDVSRVSELSAQGVVLRYFFTSHSNYDTLAPAWAAQYTLAVAARTQTNTYFVVVAAPGEEVALDAQEMKSPAMDIREAERLIADTQAKLRVLDGELSRVAASEALLNASRTALRERLQSVRVTATAQQAADGTLLVMEGWAEKETSNQVDALLERYPNVVYIKSNPTPEDNTPVKLKNRWFARIFELVGDMYARPKYGTMDLTPFFAPFYVFFFGVCLNDAGYGLVLLAMGGLMLSKFREQGMMRRAAWFATLCASSTILFGGFCGSFFGLSLQEYFPNVPFYNFQTKFFAMSLVLGLVQILFGMALNIWMKARAFGIRYALDALGWLIMLLSTCFAVGLPMAGMAIPGFAADSMAFYVALAVGGVLMFFFNTPGANPLMNIGVGVWNLYNNTIGLLSDVLSYIRLFAIGLSGGVLALVFNTLAQGFVPDGANIVVTLLVMIPILLIGHTINLFMSCISSFVHPMRLTFVEFFKNAGFEMSNRTFDPIRKIENVNE